RVRATVAGSSRAGAERGVEAPRGGGAAPEPSSRGGRVSAVVVVPERTLELAALRHAWREWWARSKQVIPQGHWRSIGFLTGRGYGKTAAVSEFVAGEAFAGRARRIALIAQNEDKTREVMVEGESGLIATSPPWFKPQLVKGVLTWPKGAQ